MGSSIGEEEVHEVQHLASYEELDDEVTV